MNRTDLKQRLQELNIREDAYYMEDGVPPDETYVLENVYSRWYFYYSERGHRSGEMEFESEDQACRYMLERLCRDPTTGK